MVTALEHVTRVGIREVASITPYLPQRPLSSCLPLLAALEWEHDPQLLLALEPNAPSLETPVGRESLRTPRHGVGGQGADRPGRGSGHLANTLTVRRLYAPPWKRSVSAMGCLAPAPSAPVGRGCKSSGMWLLTSRPATCQPRRWYTGLWAPAST